MSKLEAYTLSHRSGGAAIATGASRATKSAARPPEPTALVVMVILLLVGGLVFWPLLLLAIVVGVMAIGQQSQRAVAATPPATNDLPITDAAREMLGDGPGLFLVCGVDRESGLDTSMRIRAESSMNAKVKAEMRGMVVTKIDLP